MNLLKKFYKKEIKEEIDYFFLALVVLFFSLLRIPSLVEPNWYGDEGIYQVIGRALNSGRMLYSEIWDNKPPLLYLLYAVVNGDLFLIRLLSLVFGIGAIVVFFYVAKNIFLNNRFSVYVSTFLFGLFFGVPLLEGNIANAENFMLLPILLSFLIVLKIKKNSSIFFPISSGLLLSISFLIKIVALFDFLAFILILFILRFYNTNLNDFKKHFLSRPYQFAKVIKQELALIISFIIPILLTSLFFIVSGVFKDFFNAAFSQNIGYVGYGNYLSIHFGIIQLSIPQGILFLKIIILISAVYLIILFRKKMSRAGIIIYLWTAFSLFNSFFSGRPYTHYILVALPALCLFIGFLFEKNKSRAKAFHFFIIIIIVLLLRNNFWIYTKIIPYYKNYIDFVSNKKNVDKYQEFFDRITPRDYEIARFIRINTNKEDNVFVISDSGQIYYLAEKLPPGRYIVSYHITFYKDGITETIKDVERKKPKYIIVTKEGNLKNNFIRDYNLRYILNDVKIYEREI